MGTSNASRWVFMCSGQGSQKPGMGAGLAFDPAVARVFECASDIFGIDVRALSTDAPADILNDTRNAQAVIAATSIGVAQSLMERGVEPGATMGLSLGQISALAVSGMLSVEATFRLLNARAAAMDRSVHSHEGAMSAFMKGSPREVEEVCAACAQGDVLAAANYNAPAQTVVSGTPEAVARAERAWIEKGHRARRLATAGAFHSPLMQQAADEFAGYLANVHFDEARIPLICNTDARPLDASSAPQHLIDHLTHPVRFEQSIRSLSEHGFGKFAEVGYGGALSNLVKRILPAAERTCIQDSASIEAFARGDAIAATSA